MHVGVCLKMIGTWQEGNPRWSHKRKLTAELPSKLGMREYTTQLLGSHWLTDFTEGREGRVIQYSTVLHSTDIQQSNAGTTIKPESTVPI